MGVARGFGEGAVDTVSGLWECGSAIVDCGKNVWSFAGAVKDDPSVAWRAMTDDVVDDWNNDNQGEAIGRGAFSVVELVFGLKGVGRLSKASKAGEGAAKTAAKAHFVDGDIFAHYLCALRQDWRRRARDDGAGACVRQRAAP